MQTALIIHNTTEEKFIEALLSKLSSQKPLVEPTSVKKEEEYLTLQQTCSFFQKTPQTIHAWKKSGKLPYYRISGRIYFKKSELQQALRRIDRKKGGSHEA